MTLDIYIPLHCTRNLVILLVADGTLIVATGVTDVNCYVKYTALLAISYNGSVSRCNEGSYFFENVNELELDGATGGLLKLPTLYPDDDVPNYKSHYQDTPVICAGHIQDALIYNRECFRLDTGVNKMSIGQLSKNRIRAASVSIKYGSALWVTGGDDGNNVLDSTEYLNVVAGSESTEIVSSEGPRLPRTMVNHCLDMITDNLAILYGGEIWGAPFENSWTYDLDTRTNPNEEWVERAPMSTSRERHGCGVLRDALSPEERKIVVAAGGCNRNNHKQIQVLDSVELLHVNGPVIALQWVPGPTMPVPLCDAASANIVDGTRLFLASGILEFYGVPYPKSQSVYYLQCRLTQCQWTTVGLELHEPRYDAIAMVVPLIDRRNFSIETTLPFGCEGRN